MMIATIPLCEGKRVYVDSFDMDHLYPYGYVCCNDCILIVQSRAAWMDYEGNFIPTITRLSAVPSDDPWYVR